LILVQHYWLLAMDALAIVYATVPLVLVQPAHARVHMHNSTNICYNSKGVRILCPMNKTQTIVVSVIVGVIVLFLVIYFFWSWYEHRRSMRSMRTVVQGIDDEIHLQSHVGMSQYGQLPSDETLTEPQPAYYSPDPKTSTHYDPPNYPPPKSHFT